jgi:hypothetical protein
VAGSASGIEQKEGGVAQCLRDCKLGDALGRGRVRVLVRIWGGRAGGLLGWGGGGAGGLDSGVRPDGAGAGTLSLSRPPLLSLSLPLPPSLSPSLPLSLSLHIYLSDTPPAPSL